VATEKSAPTLFCANRCANLPRHEILATNARRKQGLSLIDLNECNRDLSTTDMPVELLLRLRPMLVALHVSSDAIAKAELQS
jgi:hypothetical protein